MNRVSDLNNNILFLYRQAGVFPSVNAAVEMVNELEIVFLKDFQRSGAAAARSAVDEIGFGFIEGVDALLEIGAMEIDVRCACNVERFEFLGCANIEDDEVCLRKQFLGAPGIDVFDGRRSRNIGGIGG